MTREDVSRLKQGRGKDSIGKSWCKSLLGRSLSMGISERYRTTKRNGKAPKKVEGNLHDYGSAPAGTLS